MDEKLVVANWKAHKTLEESLDWIEKVGTQMLKLEKTIVLCPPTVFLAPIAEKIKTDGLSEVLILGSQNVSHYPVGAYTGEVAAEQLADLVQFSLVGHSERRKYFGETKDIVAAKFNLAKQSGINPILCFDLPQINEIFEIADSELICAYEPLSAIGTSNPETPENAEEIVRNIKSKKPQTKILYGGSVIGENVRSFLAVCDGVLVGAASVSPDDFLKIISNI